MKSYYKKKSDPKDPNYVSAVEKRFPRIAEKIVLMWGAAEFPQYLSTLMIDKRGDRQGFPFDVLEEFMFLNEFHDYRQGKRTVVDKSTYRIA
jgi:hypothetical protein